MKLILQSCKIKNHCIYIHNPAQETWVSSKCQGQWAKDYNPVGLHSYCSICFIDNCMQLATKQAIGKVNKD